ncbi:MAG: hypothetical protein ACK5YR_23320 [Pirellula sp.]|jgi:hypothetical protein
MDVKKVTKLVLQLKQLADEILNAIEEDRKETLQKLDLPMRSQEDVARMVGQRMCLRCSKPLGDGKETRGVHERCYQKLRRDNAVENATIAGYCLPRGTPGKPAEPTFPASEILKAAIKKTTEHRKKPKP